MNYELFYLIGASKEANLPKIKEEAEKIVTENGGVFAEKETLEKRRMAYVIKHETHGIYIARRFELEDVEKIQTIIQKLNLYPEVMRFIISRAEDLPELKSKEERIKESSAKNEETRVKAEPKKPAPAASEAVKKAEKITEEKSETAPPKKEKSATQEDIDKKLEEILNI